MTYKSLFLATALLAVSIPATAHAQTDPDGGWRQDQPWLQTKGPDEAGNYRARISLSDLDITKKDGARKMQRRVRRGINWTCWLMTTDPGLMGDRLPSMSECRKEALSLARPQVELALAAARQGKKVASLQMGLRDDQH